MYKVKTRRLKNRLTTEASTSMETSPTLMSCSVTVYHPVGLVIGTHCSALAWCAVSYLWLGWMWGD